MAIVLQIYSNANTTSKSISVDFVGDILAASNTANVGSSTVKYYFKFSTGAKDELGAKYDPKIILKLDELALNNQKQSQTDTAAAYTSITNMVVDMVYDYVHGHRENQFVSGVSERRPLQF